MRVATHVIFRVVGVPAPQGSKTAVMRGKRPILIEGSSTVGREAHRAWREAVGWAAKEQVSKHGPFGDDVPLHVQIAFAMPRPKSRPKKAIWADRKPDLDKLIRSTFDGLSDGGLVRHDSRVVTVTASKSYAKPGKATGAIVMVTEADNGE